MIAEKAADLIRGRKALEPPRAVEAEKKTWSVPDLGVA